MNTGKRLIRKRGGDVFLRRTLLPALALSVVLLLALLADPLSVLASGGKRLSKSTHAKSDRLVHRKVSGQRITYMFNNVFIDRDTFAVKCDTLIYYEDQNVYEFMGHVHFTRDSTSVDCSRSVYNRGQGEGDYFGGVRIIEGDVVGTGIEAQTRDFGRNLLLIGDALLITPDYTIRADTISRDRETGVGEAFSNVKIMEPASNNLIVGEHAIFLAEDDVVKVDIDPVFTSREQGGATFYSEAGAMTFFRQENKVVMLDSVRIRQGQTHAQGDTATAYGQEHLVLLGNPQVSMGTSNSMRGDRIDFFYADQELRQVILTDKAVMEDSTPDSLASVYVGLPRMDVLEGDSITVDFRREKIYRSTVVGNAHSLYTPMDLDEEVATNDVVGDTITIHFRKERVSSVEVDGSMSGTYRFAKVAAMRDMLKRSRRLVDMLAVTGNDSAAFADSLTAAGVDSFTIANADSMLVEHFDTMANMVGVDGLSEKFEGAGIANGGIDDLLTMALDSLSVAGFDTSQSGLDFLASAEDVTYAGQSVVFDMKDKSIDIRDEAQINYGTMLLTAEHITLDTQSRELYAEGNPLIDDSDVVAGKLMGFNFGSRTGAVVDGVTTMDGYYYVGDEIRRFPDTTMKICSGKMSSCDLEKPHYHFWADKMKIKAGDKIVAAPIVLRIGRVPLFALPFYFKSLKEGRQSGILFPSFEFGFSRREGRYIRDFGYYWATNDYMDFTFEADYNERQDFGYRLSNRYVKRYGFNGGIDYSRKVGLGERKTEEWQLRWNHNQPILFDDYKFRADVKLASTTLTSNDLNDSNARDIVSGQQRSNVYLSRNFSFMSTNLNASRDERTNATDDDPNTDNLLYNMTLPSLSLSFKQITLAPALRSGQSGSFLGNLARNTYFQQGYKFNAKKTGKELSTLNNYTGSGNWSLNLRPPRIGIFNIGFNGSASQNWKRNTSEGKSWVSTSDTTGYYENFSTEEEETKPGASMGASLGTTLYGLIPINVGRLQAVRHTVKMNTGWTARPGLPGHQDHTTSYSLSMNNRLDVKYLGGAADTTQASKKLDGVIDWSLSTSYNPKAEPEDRWGKISSGLTLKPGESRHLRLKVSNSIDPRTLALLSTRFNYALSFQGQLDIGEVAIQQEATKNNAIDRLGVDLAAEADSLAVAADAEYDEFAEEDFFEDEADPFNDFGDRPGRDPSQETEDPTKGGRIIPFDISASMSYSYTNSSKRKSATGNFSLRTNLTKNWDARYTTGIDFVTGDQVRQQFSLNRELHCWKLEFNRTINTNDSSFGFRIYLKSIPAMKYTRGEENYMGSVGGAGSSLF